MTVLQRVEENPRDKDTRLDETIAEATALGLTVTSHNDTVTFEGIRSDNGAYVNLIATADKEHNLIHFQQGETRLWTYRSIPVNILALLTVICLVAEFIVRRREARKA